jgi:hypothetical protein
MNHYQGATGDTPKGSFGFILKGLGTPNEVFNFLPYRGRCYGYASMRDGRVNIERLGAKRGAEFIDDVLVIWTATQPGVGNVIVGWYDGARVFAKFKVRPQTRKVGSEEFYYSTVAPANVCRLLSLDERVFPVERHKKHDPGTAAAFFPEGVSPKRWVDSIRHFVATGVIQPNVSDGHKGPNRPGRGRSVDPKYRLKVENAAINHVTAHYEKLRYIVTSYEKDNRGWDLEAKHGRATLKLEVKGLSGNDPIVEVTPNEYRAIKSHLHRSSYRLCIVTNALAMACTRFRRHRVRCFNGTGGGSWRGGSLRASSSLKRYV